MSYGAILGVALLTAVACLLLRQYNPVAGLGVAMAGGAVLLLFVLGIATDLITYGKELLRYISPDEQWFSLLIKALGISYLFKFGADLSRDAGETAVAGYVETAGKVLMVALSLPWLTQIVKTVAELLQ